MDLNKTIQEHVERLPLSLQSEVLDFVLYLEQKTRRQIPPTDTERRARIAKALEHVVALNPFGGIDPLTWQQEHRQERILPDRDE
jgi:hypothetical protein